ncbi:hypothetical protein AOLI_G00273230 [Acnodon oligacanthus]
MAEVVEELQKTELRAAPSAPCYAGPGDVECDFCTGRKLRAVKSCLTCLASFCETHLQPHSEVPSWKKHKLVKASSQLQEKICSQHDKLIENYCRTDQSCICYMCMMDKHRGHDTVPAITERTQKQCLFCLASPPVPWFQLGPVEERNITKLLLHLTCFKYVLIQTIIDSTSEPTVTRSHDDIQACDVHRGGLQEGSTS